MKNKTPGTFIISILIPVAVGSVSSLLSGNMSVYQSLNKPPLSPPGFIFPVVWTILYILMGVSSYIIYLSQSPTREKALKIYAVQLAINFFWSILFFRFSQYFLSFLWLVLLIAAIIIMIKQFYQIHPSAALLQVPYLLWCIFAAWLNFMIFYLN